MSAPLSRITGYTCVPCEVSWRSMDPRCWMCGTDTSGTTGTGGIETGAGAGSSVVRAVGSVSGDAARMSPAAPQPGTPLTRWGSNVHERQARGLPDPRAPRSA